ncbi:MAG: phosphomannomutase/phosphoglucomutase [Gammaproteobacteria bacterium]|nr:phosphomannomutase/phosphoglucomutase [Gammaproteobacteria bacterium]
MPFPHEIFKAYDIRGVVDTTLTAEMVEQVGKAFGSEAIEQGVHSMVLGWDGRLSGPRLAAMFARGVLSTGCNVIEIAQVPTPALYFATVAHCAGTGVQVTGSHNPPEYNGLKMMIAGSTLSGEAIQEIKQRVLARRYCTGSGSLVHEDILARYRQAIVDDITLARPLKLVIDCGNGVAGAVAPKIFKSLGCEVTELFCEVDGHFPNHHPDPSRLENLQDLIRAVGHEGADFGMAFDGDGDRLGVVSADGSVIWPDRQMVLFSREILNRTPGAEIIFDVKCSQILPRTIRENGGKPTMWKTGHAFIKNRLRESGAVLAGEMSGHIFFNDRWGGFDDGIYAGARLCELLASRPESPGEVFAALPDTVNTPELRLDMEEGAPHELVRELIDLARFDGATVNTIDGVRADFEDGFGLIRASNTTPTLILRFEAGSPGQLEFIQEQFRSLIRSARPSLPIPF